MKGLSVEIKSTTQLQARGHYTLVLDLSFAQSLLKTQTVTLKMQNSNKCAVPLDEFMS
jgi:hypothetical protein